MTGGLRSRSGLRRGISLRRRGGLRRQVSLKRTPDVVPVQPEPPPIHVGWIKLFEDDFENSMSFRTGGPSYQGNRAGTGIWTPRYEFGAYEDEGHPGNGSAQFPDPLYQPIRDAGYMQTQAIASVCEISATPRPAYLDAVTFSTAPSYTTSPAWFSGVITTQHSVNVAPPFFAEARVMFPGGKGCWGAWWLLNVEKHQNTTAEPAAEDEELFEIDVAEHVSHQPNYTNSAIHWHELDGNPAGYQALGEDIDRGLGDISAGWHDYGVKVLADKITFYIDRVKIHEIDWPAGARQAPLFYLIFNLELGGVWDGLPLPDGTTPDPSTLKIDWVRVWGDPVLTQRFIDVPPDPGLLTFTWRAGFEGGDIPENTPIDTVVADVSGADSWAGYGLNGWFEFEDDTLVLKGVLDNTLFSSLRFNPAGTVDVYERYLPTQTITVTNVGGYTPTAATFGPEIILTTPAAGAGWYNQDAGGAGSGTTTGSAVDGLAAPAVFAAGATANTAQGREYYRAGVLQPGYYRRKVKFNYGTSSRARILIDGPGTPAAYVICKGGGFNIVVDSADTNPTGRITKPVFRTASNHLELEFDWLCDGTGDLEAARVGPDTATTGQTVIVYTDSLKAVSYGAALTLQALTLSNNAILEGDTARDVGTIGAYTTGSTLSLQDDDGGRFAIVNGVLRTTTTAVAAGTSTVVVRETLTGATGSPKDTTFAITVQASSGAPSGSLPSSDYEFLVDPSGEKYGLTGTYLGTAYTNEAVWVRKRKDIVPNLTSALLAAVGAQTWLDKTGSFTVANTEQGNHLNITGPATVVTRSAAQYGNGGTQLFYNAGGGLITVTDPAAAVLGSMSNAGSWILISSTGSALRVLDTKGS